MKEIPRGTSRILFFIVHWSVSAHMFQLQALGWWLYRTITVSVLQQNKHPNLLIQNATENNNI